jgi:Galactose oxidase, central domain
MTAETYDIAAVTFTATDSMSTGRYGHTATLLTDGTVLITGGIKSSDGNDGGISTSTAEIYDPSSNTYTPTGTMEAVRDLHAATLISNGKVFVTGGDFTLPSAEIFDPATRTFSATGSMGVRRSAHAATQLRNGEVLVAGGATTEQCIRLDACGVTATIELFDPATGTFTPYGSMHIGRSARTATLLTDGEVLLAGGEGDVTGVVPVVSSEIEEPGLGSPATGAQK